MSFSHILNKIIEIIDLWIYFLLWNIRQFNKKHSDSVQCLVGKTAIVTGGNSGIGYVTCCLLASRGCRVIIADKNTSEKSKNEIIEKTKNPNVILEYVDFSSLKSVREFAGKIRKTEKKIDILVNNAGIGISKDLKSDDGLNMVMQINYFSSFLLTHLLLEPLSAAKSARVVFTGSVTAGFHSLDVDTFNPLNYEKTPSNNLTIYSNSKLCNLIAAQEFSRRFSKVHGISFNSIDPGIARTFIYNHEKLGIIGRLRSKFGLELFIRLYQTDTFTAAQSTFHVASSEKLENESGQHFFYCEPFKKPWICYDEKMCEFIWKKSEELVQLKKEEKFE